MGTLWLKAHLFRSSGRNTITGLHGADSSYISEIASKMRSLVSASSVSSLQRGGTAKVDSDLSGLWVSLNTVKNCCCSVLTSSFRSVICFNCQVVVEESYDTVLYLEEGFWVQV